MLDKFFFNYIKKKKPEKTVNRLYKKKFKNEKIKVVYTHKNNVFVIFKKKTYVFCFFNMDVGLLLLTSGRAFELYGILKTWTLHTYSGPLGSHPLNIGFLWCLILTCISFTIYKLGIKGYEAYGQ